MKALKRFLGMVNFYHRFVPSIAQIQVPLQDAIKTYKKGRNTPLNWSP